MRFILFHGSGATLKYLLLAGIGLSSAYHVANTKNLLMEATGGIRPLAEH